MLDGTRTENPLSRDELREVLKVIKGSKTPDEEPFLQSNKGRVVTLRIISLNRPLDDLGRLLGYFADRVIRGEEAKIIFAPSNPVALEQSTGVVVDFVTHKRINL